jgi:hypothetical protein
MARIKVVIEIDPSVPNNITIDPFDPDKAIIDPFGAGLTQVSSGAQFTMTVCQHGTITPNDTDTGVDFDCPTT